MRKNYWSCSKLADFILGIKTPPALSSRGWDNWETMNIKERPFRYWIAKEGLDKLQNIFMYIPDKLYTAKYYLKNRFITQSHALVAKPQYVKRGEWCDLTYRMLPCLFGELEDFVEIELAWSLIAWDDDAHAKYEAPWYARGWFKLDTWRSKEAGLEYLEWASKLDNKEWVDASDPSYGELTNQAISAIEVKALYDWWTEVYPNRPDPYDASGWSEYCAAAREETGKFLIGECPEHLIEIRDESHLKLLAIEKQYEDEDTEMMIRLIKVRHALWT